MSMTYKQLNDEPIEIEYFEFEDEEDFVPCFMWADVLYRLDNFIRVHNNPWVGGSGSFPEYIHGYEAGSYFHPLFIELVGDEAVNVYREVVEV